MSSAAIMFRRQYRREIVQLSKICAVKVTKDNPEELFYKTSFKENDFRSLVVTKNKRQCMPLKSNPILKPVYKTKVIGRSPYKALFGVHPKAGYSPMNLPRDLLDKVENEDDLRMLEEHMENDNLQEELQSDAGIGNLNNMVLMEEMEGTTWLG
nr:unnamed protein product [Callosobruchus chinensis]